MRKIKTIIFAACLLFSTAYAASPIYVDPVSGSDANTGENELNAKQTITAALAAVDIDGQVRVLGGNITENVTIAKLGVQLISDPASETTEIQAATSVTNSAIITVAADNVVIDGFTFNVNQPSAAVGVNFQSGNNLTVSNNVMYTTGSGADASAYAAGIPTQSIGVAANNLGKTITVTSNSIGFTEANSPSSIAPFDRALFLRSVNGSVTGNAFCGINHDAAIQFVHGAPMVISGNSFLGWGNDNYKGAQLDLTEPENSVSIIGNTFTPQADDIVAGRSHVRSLMIKNNGGISSANFVVSGNTFNLRKIGILAANSIGETINANHFVAQPGATGFVGIQISNKVPTSGAVAPRTNNAIITANTFGPGTGSGIQFLNHNSSPAPAGGLFDSIIVGGAGVSANSFDAGLTEYIDLDGQTGSSQASGITGYASLGNTTMAAFPLDLDISANNFASSLGSAANQSQSFEIENKIAHRIDTDRPLETGLASWITGQVFVTDPSSPGSKDSSIQRGIDAAAASNTINIESGNYTELVHANKADQKLLGDNLPALNAPVDSGNNNVVVQIQAAGVTVEGLGVVVNQPYAAAGIVAKGTSDAVTGSNILNNTITTTGNGGIAASGGWTPFGSATGEAATAVSIFNTGSSSAGFTATVKGNTIGTAAAPFSQAGIFFERALGIIGGSASSEGNTIYGEDFDIIARFVALGSLTVQGNHLNGWGFEGYRGAQMEIGDPGANGTVTVEGNIFTPQAGTSPHGRTNRRSLQVKNYYSPTGSVSILNNVFNVQNTGLALTNDIRAYVQGNAFEAAADNALLVEINNKIYSSSDSFQDNIGGTVSNSATLLSNSFNNNSNFSNVTALEFRDHTQTNANPTAGPIQFKDLLIGQPGSPNTFANSLSTYISLSNLDGPTNGAGSSIYGTIASVTEMDPFAKDIIAAYNNFGTGPEVKLPSTANASELLYMESKIQDKDDIAALGQVFLFAPVINVQTSQYFATIQAAVNAPDTLNGHVLEAYPTVFNELVTLNKQLTLKGQSVPAQATGHPIVRAPQTGSGAAVISVDAANVTVQDLQIIAENPYAWTGIRGINNNFDNLTIHNNTVTAEGAYTYSSGQYHNGIELGNFGSLSRTVNLSGNSINAAPGDTAFQRGIYLRTCNGNIGGPAPADGNIIKAGIQDLLDQFSSFGPTDIRNNTFLGAGVDLTEPESHGPVTIAQNNFAPEAIQAQSLLIKHDYSGSLVIIDGNTFTKHQYRGIVAAGSNNVKIRNNQFDAYTGTSPYPVAHIELNTRWPGTIGAPYNPNSYEVTGNSFKNTGTSQVDGILIANGQAGSQTPDFDSLVIGQSGTENDFYAGLNRFIVLSDASGQVANVDIDITANRFDIGSGLQLPSELAFAQNFRLEDRIAHKVDAPATGLAFWIADQIFVTTPAAGSTDSDLANGIAASGAANATVNVEPGIYSGPTAVISGKSSFTLTGSDPASRPVISSGLNFGSGTNNDIILRDIKLQGQAAGATNAIVNNSGTVTNLNLHNVGIDGENVASRFGIIGGSYNGNICIEDCQFSNIMGWAAFDTKSGGSGSVITTGSLINTSLTNVAGHVNFRQNPAVTPYPNIIITGNTITGGDSLATGAGAAIKVFNGTNVSVVNNLFDGVPADTVHVAGEEVDGAVLMPRNVSKLYVADNLFAHNNSSIIFERNQPISSGVIADNIFTENGTAIYFPNNPTAAGDLQIVDNHFDGQTTYSIRNGSTISIAAPNNWFGNLPGPTESTNGASANVNTYPWIGETGVPEDDVVLAPAGASAITLTTLAGSPQAPATVDIAPASGTFTGSELFTAVQDPTAPFQGYNGFQLPGGVPRSLFVNTQQPAGSYISTVKVGYSTFQISGYTETDLFLASWDATRLRWVPAVSRNSAGTASWQGASAPLPPTAANLGKYGIDPTNNIAWAVVDHASEFSLGSGTGSEVVPVGLSSFSLE